MFPKVRFVFALATLCLIILCQDAFAELATSDNNLNDLYEIMLQREYAGPIVFPNHQVERKAQRSPSLRLRFGRRTDPDMLPVEQKRWFGDVNQKPIRSPSLRLRFGRRSDPSVPIHSDMDAVVFNDLNDDTTGSAVAEVELNNMIDGYERVLRKPQRLRWGRSVPSSQNNYNGEEYEMSQSISRIEEFLNSLRDTEKLRKILLALDQYNNEANANTKLFYNKNMYNNDENHDIDLTVTEDEFEREARRTAPLRLRWGRSTGGQSSSNGKVRINRVATTIEPISKIPHNTEEVPNLGQDKN
ncbi:short neuropeptide F [Teleopsis dalmanni]|uniref:short neuropeptide F n=1 Tax=Teleopsis dalmanni TaxID=139649 RepID=UPI0018CFE8B6|nr:short neuropeptide F [Teleopsis dalmanni]